jgi:hypothetical protein
MARRAPAEIRQQYNERWRTLDASVATRGILLQVGTVLEMQGSKAGYGEIVAKPNKHNSKAYPKLHKLPTEFKQFLKHWNRNQRPNRRMELGNDQMKAWIIHKNGVKINGKTLKPNKNAGVSWLDEAGITHIGRVCAYVYLQAQVDKFNIFVHVQEREKLGTLGIHTTVSSGEVRPLEYIDAKRITHVVWFTPHANGNASQCTCIRLWATDSVHV